MDFFAETIQGSVPVRPVRESSEPFHYPRDDYEVTEHYPNRAEYQNFLDSPKQP